MYYDFHYKSKITKIGEKIVVALNKAIIIKILSFFMNKIKLLEIGHGRGLFADLLNQISKNENKLIDYYGIEPNQSLYREGKRKHYNLLNRKVPPFPVYKTKFHIVYLSHVLEHFINYEIVIQVLNHIYSLLVDKGYVVLLFPDYLDSKADYFNSDYSHEYILTKRRIKHLMTDSGFQIVYMKEYRGHLSGWIKIILYPFFVVLKYVAGCLFLWTNKDIFFKIKITFTKNIFVIAQKKEKK